MTVFLSNYNFIFKDVAKQICISWWQMINWRSLLEWATCTIDVFIFIIRNYIHTQICTYTHMHRNIHIYAQTHTHTLIYSWLYAHHIQTPENAHTHEFYWEIKFTKVGYQESLVKNLSESDSGLVHALNFVHENSQNSVG